ncbi:MAG: SIS domain-containing protein [Phycisphaerales bacterium]
MAGTTCATAQDYFNTMAELLKQLDPAPIDQFTELLDKARRNGASVYVFGNGGSAYNASHYVTDFVKTASVEGEPRLKAVSVVDNYGMTTALGNDISYEDTFVYPLESYAKAGDVAVAISCSGNSPNIVKACKWAKDNGLSVVAISGFKGGRMAEFADIHINVPHDNYGVIEDVHLSVGHIVAQGVFERAKAGKSA